MKVLFDHQIFERQNKGGISRYFSDLISGLPQTAIISKMYVNNLYLNKLNLPNAIPYLQKQGGINNFLWGINFKGKGRLYSLYCRIKGEINTLAANKRNAINALESFDYDVFHPTYYDPYFLKHLKDKPFVLTVYDMIHEIFSSDFGQEKNIIECKKELVNKASRVIAISENTRQDIIKIYGISKDKIDVVYLNSELNLEMAKKNFINYLPSNYLLFVGLRGSYKNFNFLCESLVQIFKKYPDLQLLAAGGGEFTPQEQITLKKLGIENRVIQLKVDDEELAACYANAIAYVCPSLYEGFGLTLLEAMQCNCPIISSDRASLKEVGGDAVMYFSPDNTTELQKAIITLIESKEISEGLVERGKTQASKFSKEKTAKETEAIYKKVVNKHEITNTFINV